MGTGQWFTDSVGRRWFFDSGALSLDFGYTGDFGFGHPAWERMQGVGDLSSWLEARFGALAAGITGETFECAIRLREAIVGAARSLEAGRAPDPADIDAINDHARAPDLAPHLTGGTRPRLTATPSRALATIARDAIRVFADDPTRIRTCGADDCRLIFYDCSRANTRRWCSMQRCGNRTKVRTHRAREASARETKP